MSYLAKKEEKQCLQLFLDQARALVFRARFLRGFFLLLFWAGFYTKGRLSKSL